ncbi:O-antigen ligase family protein [Aquiflexum sp. LQ15W]|uniref:O-antigen ligase family protein n=1 Tax=Cognataquiflexum nitidum TaxID=2922272 RepID=UPI001F134A1B|nr:O-antigen ligase family protein [Cognataquiflexum nitidum]MCH6201732.1 O-antigen ligase family protein [Cognataquiflexum nitidum]
MKVFFILTELFILIFAGYVLWKKKELVIVYLPLLLFCDGMIEKSLPATISYLIQVGMLGYLVFYNLKYLKSNIFSILIVLYFIMLLPYSKDLNRIRPDFVAAIMVFTLIPLFAEVYKKYPRDVIFEELAKSSTLILVFFIINTILSTLFKYNPMEMYGITSGILYGKVFLTDFNILVFASFLVIRKGIKDKSLIHIALYLTAVFFILLSFRRTVMALTILGTIIVMVELLNFKQIKDFILYGAIIGLVSLVVVYYTGFIDVFWERYELRNLEDRALGEEKRLMELDLMYKDFFVYFDYSPWFGYELFDYRGPNYGKGIFGDDRPLHSDYATIAHSSGLIGLILYISLVITATLKIWRRTFSRADYLQFFLCLMAFGVFFITGRYTGAAFMGMMFGLWTLPLGRKIVSKKIQGY